MNNWLSDLSAWLVGLVKAIFGAIVTLLHDLVLWVFDGLLVAILAGITALGSVCCMDTQGFNSVGALLSGLPSFTKYILSQLNLVQCMGLVVCGVGFRLFRKAVTLGQW